MIYYEKDVLLIGILYRISFSIIGSNNLKYYKKINPYPLTGLSTICNQATYSIANLPAGASVQWSASNSNLQVISGQGTSTAVFKKKGNGSCVVKATISAYGTNILSEKTVWVGVPAQPTTDPPGYPIVELGLHSIFSVMVTSSPGATGNNYIWNVTGSIESLGANPNGNHCSMEAISYGAGNYFVKSTNSCGTSVAGGGGVNVVNGGGGNWPKSVNLYPNPANVSITVDVKQVTDRINTFNLKKQNIQIQLWQNYNLIKTIRTKSLQTEIPISSLKTGYYYVVVIINGKKYKKQFFKQ